MDIVKLSLKNPYAVAVLALLILVMGFVAISGIAVDILPVFKAPAVQVMTYYGGMPTTSIEKTITNRIERWTNQATGCERVESKSIQGVSVVRLYFHDDVDPNKALTLVNSLALGALPTLPPNTLPPVVLPFDPTGTIPLGILSITSPDLDETQLKDLARIELRNMLGGIKGVVAPAVFGGQDRTILIYVDPQKLEARNLSPLDVVDALGRQNLMVTPGVVKFGAFEFQLDTNAMVSAVEELNNIPLRTGAGNRVYLSDVGVAKDSHTIQTGLVRINGHRQVYVPIYRQQGASSLTVVSGVRAELAHMEETFKANGKNVHLELVMDQSVYVKNAIESLIHEGIIGAVLVAVMILIFLGNWRMTLFATMSIPLAILVSLICLSSGGNTINAMTLGGLALAIGPLVDVTIVVLENTHRHQTLGKSSLRAAYDGATEVIVPVFVATLTTIIVLCPIALMPGMGGFLFRPLTLALAFAMLASFVLSVTLIPALCAKYLKHEHPHPGDEHVQEGIGKRLYQRIDAALHRLTQRYAAILEVALRHRALVLTTVGILFLASLTLLLGIGREFFPQVDAGQITMYVRCGAGTNLEATEQRIIEVEKFITDVIPASERTMLVSELGLVPDWSAAYTANSGTQDAVLKIQLNDERTKSAQEYAIELRHRLAGASEFADMHFSFDTGGMISAALNYGASSPIDLQIAGGKTEEAHALAERAREWIAKVPGAADVRVLQRLDAKQLLIDVDRAKASDADLTEAQVVGQVVTAMNSSISLHRVFWIDPKSGNQYFVAVQYPEDANRRLEDVLDIPVTGGKDTHPVKLSSLASIRPASAPVEMNHVNLARTFDVLVNTENIDIGTLVGNLNMREFQQNEWKNTNSGSASVPPDSEDGEMNFPGGIRVAVKGEYSRMTQSFGSLGFGLVLAALLVYLLLVVLFRSFVGPGVIMFTIPLGLIGVLGMLYVTHTTLNVQSSMGVIFMVGIVVSNGVLLVDFANKQRKLGADIRTAIQLAATIRFRPILMTFLATFLDLIPMAIGLGRGSEANVPLARAVVGGLLTSTCLTLVIVPIMYTLLSKEQTSDVQSVDEELAETVPAH
ncbi:MAG TPA: efflux RND transporter permease subunit [Pirellulales bacterium]|nr:efflux RND transporter permease subunit [Pirellulales bacterium]